jgi:molybdopterin converting factor small subunit
MTVAVEIQLFATLRRFAPQDATRLALAEGTSVAQLIARLGIPPAEARLVFVDGRRAEPDAILADGAQVGIFPPVGGG